MSKTFVLLLIVRGQIRRLERIARYLQARIDGGQRPYEKPVWSRWLERLPSRE